MKVIAISDARDPTEQTPLPEETWLYVGGGGYPAQIRPVDPDRHKDRRGHQNGRYPVSRILVVLPICRVEAVSPGNGPFLGGERPWHYRFSFLTKPPVGGAVIVVSRKNLPACKAALYFSGEGNIKCCGSKVTFNGDCHVIANQPINHAAVKNMVTNNRKGIFPFLSSLKKVSFSSERAF